ncbi:MAG: hypothetical protein PHN57_05420 [Candidatus Omnitrophica bacterium]|nr:hypothetical protein [Candidatus Omnitrophota bacterium]
MEDKRRWGRVKVPDSKLSCRIIEPKQYAVASDFPVDNINPGGLCFISDKSIQEKENIKL